MRAALGVPRRRPRPRKPAIYIRTNVCVALVSPEAAISQRVLCTSRGGVNMPCARTVSWHSCTLSAKRVSSPPSNVLLYCSVAAWYRCRAPAPSGTHTTAPAVLFTGAGRRAPGTAALGTNRSAALHYTLCCKYITCMFTMCGRTLWLVNSAALWHQGITNPLQRSTAVDAKHFAASLLTRTIHEATPVLHHPVAMHCDSLLPGKQQPVEIS